MMVSLPIAPDRNNTQITKLTHVLKTETVLEMRFKITFKNYTSVFAYHFNSHGCCIY
jgi:hypothetical protein